MDRDLDMAALSRREFARVAGVAAGLFVLPGCADPSAGSGPRDGGLDRDLPGDAEADLDGTVEADSSFDLPTLGGAPDTPEGRAIAAFLDTIVPGAHRDPTGAPGAIDVGAGALFFDPELPAAPFVPVLVLALDNRAGSRFEGRAFVALTPDERESTVAQVLVTTALLGFAIQLAKLAFFSSRGAADYLGYPGPNPGYVGHADFTFGRAMATEITDDGNLP